jgi:hypothetical protein
MTYNYLEKMKAERVCLDLLLELLIELGKFRQLSRKETVAMYVKCIKKLGNHYSCLSDALSALYKAVTEHSTFPRYMGRVPMTLKDARDHEATENGGIVTGFNRFQSWANHNKVYFCANGYKQPETRIVSDKRNKLSDNTIEMFILQLQEKHPLNRKIKITYNLQHEIIKWRDNSLLGIVIRKAGCDEVNVFVNTDQVNILVLKTIAHEYRHIMQWENTDIEWLTHSNKKHDIETDANLFSKKVALAFNYKYM